MTRVNSLRTRWAAVGAAVAVTLGAAGIGSYNLVDAEVSSGDRPVFVPLNPCRLTDTRPGVTVGPKSSPLGPDETLTITAHGSNGNCTGPSAIPTDAVALSLNVTAAGQTTRTFLTIWGDGDDPGTSNLNPEPGQPPTPNAVNTPLSNAGTFNIRNNAGFVNALIDVVGYYAHHNHDDLYVEGGALDGGQLVLAGEVIPSFGPDDPTAVVGELPPGVTVEAFSSLDGFFSVVVKGVDGSGGTSSIRAVVTPNAGAATTCYQNGSGAGPTTLSASIGCATVDGTPTNSGFNFILFLQG